MASSKEYVNYVLEQLSDLDEVSNFEVIYLCRKWSGIPKPLDGEMEELRFFEPDEIDLSEISPPIRKVMADYIEKNRIK